MSGTNVISNNLKYVLTSDADIVGENSGKQHYVTSKTIDTLENGQVYWYN